MNISGRLSVIDSGQKYNKKIRLYFAFIDDDTREKLVNHCRGDHVPYTLQEFFIDISRAYDDIDNMVGYDCDLKIKLKPYVFTSKLARNAGEKISGTKIELLHIAKQTKY